MAPPVLESVTSVLWWWERGVGVAGEQVFSSMPLRVDPSAPRCFPCHGAELDPGPVPASVGALLPSYSPHPPSTQAEPP